MRKSQEIILARALLGASVSTMVVVAGAGSANGQAIAPAAPQSTAQAAAPSADPQSIAQAAAPPATLPPEDASTKDIIVTGTSIRGVAPIGSNLVSVGRDIAEKTAAINATELTNTVPAVTTAGASPLGPNVYSYYAPTIHSLGGSASATTLVIVDGLRIPGGGTQFGQSDPNIIPSSALERVEVLADGASSIYGSDAVAGVINYITRRSFKGLEVAGRLGLGNAFHSQDANAIWGTGWDTGNVYVAAQYNYQSPLHSLSRSFLSAGDFRPEGGRNTQTFACSPATIRTPASGTNIYLSPTATTTVPNIADNAPCNTAVFGDSLPSNRRINGLVRINQTFGRLALTGTVNYNNLTGERALTPGVITNVTAFGPGSGRAGQINPFFRAPAGDPTATQETVNWLALKPDNNYGRQLSSNDTLYLYGTADYEISDKWSVKLSDALGRSTSSLSSRNIFCSSCALLALNGTANLNASTTQSSVAGASVIPLNLPLTTANALDVWQANNGATSAAVLNGLYQDNISRTDLNAFNEVKLEVQGALFDLPAGPVRVAGGLEHLWVAQDVDIVNSANIGPTSQASDYIHFDLSRNVESGYVEVVVPVVSEDMGIPLVRKLDLNLSDRVDRYSDVGTTNNPKIAANWEVMQGLRIRGNYATAFVAPPLASIGNPAQGYSRQGLGTAVVTTLLNVPVDRYPEVKLLPGCATATVTCTIGQAINQGIVRNLGAGPGAKPQTGNSWSIGVDWKPTYIPGLSASLTFWSNKFKGGMDVVTPSEIFYSDELHNRLQICPTGCTQAQINSFANVASGGFFTSAIPGTVYFLQDNNIGNVINLNVQGLDFSVSYRYPTHALGTFVIGGQGTYYTKFDQNFGGKPFSILGTSGYNITFPSIQERFRFQLGWNLGRLSADLFMNYTGSYRNWSNSSVAPITLGADNFPSGGGDLVKASSIYDFHVEYQLPEFGPLNRGAIYIDVKNLFDTDPPFFSGNQAGSGVSGQSYNAYASNPLGRIVSLGFRAKF